MLQQLRHLENRCKLYRIIALWKNAGESKVSVMSHHSELCFFQKHQIASIESVTNFSAGSQIKDKQQRKQNCQGNNLWHSRWFKNENKSSVTLIRWRLRVKNGWRLIKPSCDLPNIFYFFNKTNKIQKQTNWEVFARTSLTDKNFFYQYALKIINSLKKKEQGKCRKIQNIYKDVFDYPSERRYMVSLSVL